MSPRILTVLREGGEYRQEHVDRLRAQCARYAPGVPFLCLQGNLLTEDWPGWWAKMHIFRYSGPVLYMDLDTSVVGDLTPLLDATQQHDFIALRNPCDTPSRFGSGLMGWRGDKRHVFERFAEAPARHMARCRTRKLWGDQGFISETETPDAFWQDLLPGQVASWKVDCTQGIPPEARVVYFHGRPRPWDIGA